MNYWLHPEAQEDLREAAQFYRENAGIALSRSLYERLYAVHGVRLGQAARAAILEQGFPAWG